MADVGLRDLGSFVPGGRAKERDKDHEQGREREREPIMPSLDAGSREPGSVIVTPPPLRSAPRAIFGGDHASGADALGIDGTIAHLAELTAHRGTAAPLCIGLLGGAGSGKSFALAKLQSYVRDLATVSASVPSSSVQSSSVLGPYLQRIHIQAVDAASLDGDPATGLAARLHAGLREPYPDLAREIGVAARDPHVVLREVNEKLDDARRRLDSERRALDDAGSRRARLTETVLYEAAGSQVDAYARANRASIENRLVSFGITGDPLRNYKDLVQLVAGSGGTFGLALRSLWAFKGQTKLIVVAILLVALGIGLGIAVENQATWLGDLRAGPQSGAAVAKWFEGHMDWFGTAKSGAFLLAAFAVLANLWRAFGFLQPIFKGARLLDGDLDTRRRDLDGLYAHQTKRVDTLDGDVERLTSESAEAERRVGGPTSRSEPSPFEAAGGSAQAQGFFAVLAGMMAEPKGKATPQRIVLALDHLDAVSPERARTILDSVHRIAGAGLVSLVAVDPKRLASGSDLERWIQVPVRLDASPFERDYASLVQATLGRIVSRSPTPKPDAKQSALDEPVSDDEAAHLSALAPLAGRSPRAVKRFVNLYTLARLDNEHRGALALMLALALGGSDAEKTAVAEAIATASHDAPLDLSQVSPQLRAAVEAVKAMDGRFTGADATAAAQRAAMFSI